VAVPFKELPDSHLTPRAEEGGGCGIIPQTDVDEEPEAAAATALAKDWTAAALNISKKPMRDERHSKSRAIGLMGMDGWLIENNERL
jgi:hypothetical protein